ncbi:AMP-ligase [Caldovatus sediminis]|uniref:AMP-ligase n=1 Tax=Caldovatus sediminis TaxID=2041189 RepID=A0A8J2ZET3_9PROT|nr:AMP-binding protein [Caldovatus sediminis]GGG46737.1 AMP-ligase [Caldovatus sediminis]
MPPDAAGTIGAAPPLTPRRPEAVLFRRRGEAITVGRFLAEAAALAARLPEAPCAINLCADRYLALLGFAAALMRGQTTLLSADRSPRRLRELAERHPGAHALVDDAATLAQDAAAAACPVVVTGCAEALLPPGDAGRAVAAPRIPAERIAAIAFTSGSTGEPAPHAKPWGALVAGARAAAARFDLADPARPASIVASVPAQHMYGFETTLLLPLHAEAAGHAGPTFYPSDLAEALAEAPPRRLLVTTPLQLRALLASGAGLPALEAVISATAPLAGELAAEAERAWRTRVLEIYGATEAGSLASRRTVEGPLWRPYDGVRLRIAADGSALAEVPGLPRPVPLADELAPAGDGRFRLLGRRADVVKLAGKRASLAGLTRILNEIEGVRDGVFVAPEDLDRNPRARLAAYVVAPDRSAREIVAALRERIEPAFLPRPVVMLDALPRDAVGKLSRRALAALRPAAARRPRSDA